MEGNPLLKKMKILDFTRVLSGPFATMMLGDLGAEVTKIEPPNGDESRFWPPIMKNGVSAYFLALNRNKRSIALNLKDPQAKKIVLKLAAEADVVVENFTPGVAAKLGIDYDTLKKENPQIIYCAISGFGQDGPYRDKKAYDPIIQGMTGLMSITGERNGPPVKIGLPITDLTAASHAVTAILAATIHRMETGKGQYIDVSLYDGVISWLTTMAMDYFTTGKAPERWGLDHIHRVPARAFMASDGRWVQVAATSDVMYAKFCHLLGLSHLIEDPRFATNNDRVRHRDEIMPIFEEKMGAKTSREWLQLFEEAGIPCGPILDMEEVFASPHVKARDMMFSMPHPIEKEIPQLGFPYKFSDASPSVRRRPPLLGEHAELILGEEMGMQRADILKLIQDKVLFTPSEKTVVG
ncbi:CoA transferase [Desulfosarcina sp.]|uniref:CaiB/BaiF CoA transferase family protein n=1 Tax=Desulfosarcina sp. TaxID=2027861 RepID=UPI0029B18F92|nr:CoA transferase [Desulfosarcina sp.]MDX2452255.1 CoA transferase [Desulfosarcina sp.]MDX2490035.1 CoA transferase [Desulfosarcina sp.]